MDKTTLIFVDWLGDMIYGYNVSQVTVRDLHLTRSSPGTTQGWVRAVTTGQVVLEIPPGNSHSLGGTKARKSKRPPFLFLTVLIVGQTLPTITSKYTNLFHIK